MVGVGCCSFVTLFLIGAINAYVRVYGFGRLSIKVYLLGFRSTPVMLAFFFPPPFQSLRELLLILESLFTPCSHPLLLPVFCLFATIEHDSLAKQLTPELMPQYLILKAGQLVVTFL